MDVQIWLHELGLSQYANAFDQNDIDAAILPQLNETDLKELGLVSLGHRKKLLAAIQKLRLKQATTASQPTIGSENRQVTVLFADIAGFVALSGQLGAEPTYDLLNQYFNIVDDIIERYGGRVDKHIGDNVMGVFGVLQAHKDDPERAVRAALEIREAVIRLGETVNCPLHIHIGIANGQVVASHMGSHIHDEYTVIGPAVNLAARLEGLSGLDEILISDSVKRAIGDLVLAENLDQTKIKGIDQPVTVWRVQHLAARPTEHQKTQFIGRQHDLAILTQALQTCLKERKGQTIYIRGEAGIGKTRLLKEFRQLAKHQGVISHGVTILDFGVGSRQDIFRPLAQQLLGLTDDLEQANISAYLQPMLASIPKSETALMHLQALLKLPLPKASQALYEAMDNQTRWREKVRVVGQLAQINSQHHPLIITLDDLHWIDTSHLTQLAYLINELANSPILLVLTSRIEGDPLDAFWCKQIPTGIFHRLDLKPLSYNESLALVQSEVNFDATFALRCVQRAEGNPFFLEQLMRSGQSALDPQLPGSLQSVVLGRVDQLDPLDKKALQTASILGQRFSLPVLRHLLDHHSYTCENLLESFLICTEGDDYRFSHALIHDGVYLALLKSRRQHLHQQAAQWFRNQDLDLWAGHLDRADDTGAPSAYCQVAKAHYQAFRYDLALSLAQRGLELALSASDRYELTCLLATLVQIVGNPTQSIDLYREAASLAPTDQQACQAWLGVAAGVRLSGGYDEGLIALDRAVALVPDQNSERILSKIHYFKGNFAYSKGDLDGCFQAQQQALDYALQVQDPELEARALGGLADAVYARRRIKTAMDYYQRCVDVAHTHGFVQIEMANRHMLAAMMRYMHDYDGAISNNQITLETARQIGNRRTLMYTLDNQGELLTERGEYDAASESIASALELSYALNNKRYRAYIMQRLARAKIGQGKLAEARTILEQALKICYETDIQFVAPRVLGLLALVSEGTLESWNFLQQGDQILSQGCISHNFFWFYRDAIETSLHHQDWPRAHHYGNLLADYTRTERFPWSQFVVDRGHCLADIGQGKTNHPLTTQLKQLYTQANQVGLGMPLKSLQTTLKTIQ